MRLEIMRGQRLLNPFIWYGCRSRNRCMAVGTSHLTRAPRTIEDQLTLFSNRFANLPDQ